MIISLCITFLCTIYDIEDMTPSMAYLTLSTTNHIYLFMGGFHKEFALPQELKVTKSRYVYSIFQ